MANGNHNLNMVKKRFWFRLLPKPVLSIFSFLVNGIIVYLRVRSKNPGVPFDSFLSLIFISITLKIPATFFWK